MYFTASVSMTASVHKAASKLPTYSPSSQQHLAQPEAYTGLRLQGYWYQLEADWPPECPHLEADWALE